MPSVNVTVPVGEVDPLAGVTVAVNVTLDPVVIVVDASSGKMVAGPEIHARGSGIDGASFGDVLPRIEEALALAAADGITDTHQISQLARRIVGKWVSDNYRRRPMIIPVVIQA